jgi:hypothetical protein
VIIHILKWLLGIGLVKAISLIHYSNNSFT